MSVAPEPVWELGALLGEGPVWLPEEGALRFVDIKGGNIHRFAPESGARDTLEIGGKPSFIVPSEAGLLIGSEHGIYELDDGGFGAQIAALPQPAHNRTNDATVDPSGRLWFGTMDDREEEVTGAVWCLDRGQLHRAGPEAMVTNGPAVSGDGRWLYHVDSFAQTIWRFPLGPEPVLANGEVFVQLGAGEGFTDGIVIDSEDCLWVALWDGWGVRRYAPDGTLMAQIPFPCARVTKVAFGGPGLATAYATTARTGLDGAALAEQPLAGSLFAFPAPAPGRVLPKVRLG